MSNGEQKMKTRKPSMFLVAGGLCLFGGSKKWQSRLCLTHLNMGGFAQDFINSFP